VTAGAATDPPSRKFVALTDGVVTLLPWDSKDAALVTEVCQDLEISRWLPIPQPYTHGDGRDYVNGQRKVWREGPHLPLKAVEAVSGDLVGSVELRIQGFGEIGYWVRREARGRGYATRAVRLLTGFALTDLKLARVHIMADERNLASIRVAEGAGYVREGSLRSFGHFPGREPFDMAILSRLPGDRDVATEYGE
jgi:RimJ/RimL family protein N-acetyltransferase